MRTRAGKSMNKLVPLPTAKYHPFVASRSASVLDIGGSVVNKAWKAGGTSQSQVTLYIYSAAQCQLIANWKRPTSWVIRDNRKEEVDAKNEFCVEKMSSEI